MLVEVRSKAAAQASHALFYFGRFNKIELTNPKTKILSILFPTVENLVNALKLSAKQTLCFFTFEQFERHVL